MATAAAIAASLWVMSGCDSSPPEIAVVDGTDAGTERLSPLEVVPPQLSAYKLFDGDPSELVPADGVLEYELNTPLFSDYSSKQRLIKLPAGQAAGFTPTGPLDFPPGTVIAKTFYYLADTRDPNSERDLIETRILELTPSGWMGVSYIWNEEQTDADISIAGRTTRVSWIHEGGETLDNNYIVPNFNDCKRCHTPDLTMQPIGPKASNLNREVVIDGRMQNQLVAWKEAGALTGLRSISDVTALACWDDETIDLDSRARAYLEVNCAHCHNPEGPARSSGLHLNVEETEP